MALYNFTDTRGSASEAGKASEEVVLNYVYLCAQVPGFRTLYVKGRESLSAEVDLIDGGKHDGDFYNYKRYPARIITVGFQLVADTPQEYRARWNTLSKYLNVENAIVYFEDEQDKFFRGTPGEISEIEPGKNKIVGEFQIVCADPFKYSRQEYSAEVVTHWNTDPTVINYNGTVPTKPRIESELVHEGDQSPPWGGAASWFEIYELNENVLTFDGGDIDETVLATLDSSTANPSSGGWTMYKVEKTFDPVSQAMCEGFFEYETDTPTNCYRFRASLNSQTTSASPMIEILRDYANGIPQTELRFKVGDKVVYTEYLDDKNGGKFPFRISYERASVLTSVKRGYMVCIATFQFGDFIYTHKYTETVDASTASNYDITGAMVEKAKYYMSTGNVTGKTHMSVINSTAYNEMHPFLFGVPHVVDVENGKLVINDLYTPYPNNPANNWEGFELKPGRNTARAVSSGISSGYFKATYYWREKFL